MRITSRGEWGARPPRSKRLMLLPTSDCFLHHSAGALDANGNGVWWDDVRAIQDFHMDGRGWSDIAYSFVVGGGQVFEGRGAGVVGGHTKGHNSTSHAICLIGNYDAMQPHPADLSALVWLVKHGREQGWWGDLSGGHRDAKGAATACPGKNLYLLIPRIRIAAQGDDMDPELARMIRELHAEMLERRNDNAWGLLRTVNHHMVAADGRVQQMLDRLPEA